MIGKAHFIGVGGIGMSALARILLQQGVSVTGSDAKHTALLKSLQNEGVTITDDVDDQSVVVYSTAIAKDHPQLSAAKETGSQVLHRAELLQKLLEQKQLWAVTGTHGKTTTSGMLAWVLACAEKDPSFAIGGLIDAMGGNGGHGKGSIFVAEADESDGSFLNLHPHAAIVTSGDCDHFDHWKTQSALDKAYSAFAKRAKCLVWCRDDAHLDLHGKSYGEHPESDYQLCNWRYQDGMSHFDLSNYRNIELRAFGKHNALNAAAVFALCIEMGIDEGAIREGLRTFPGVKRRQTLLGINRDVMIFDDYAHHPLEVRFTLQALKKAHPDRRLVALFQPHRFTRLQSHFDEFARCFDDADLTFITDVYTAGEQPIDGIDGQALAKAAGARHVDPINVPQFLRPGDLLIIMGAGDNTEWGPEFLEADIPKLKVALLYGGTSPEHDISVVSANFVADHLDKELYNVFSCEDNFCENISEIQKCDVAFPIFHGPCGEDGMIQGFLKTLNVPFVGCDDRSSSFCMDKIVSKQIASHSNVNIAPFTWADRAEEFLDVQKRTQATCSYPLWVKGAHLGSSLGIFKVECPEGLQEALEKAFTFDHRVIIENHTPGRELEIAVLGNEELLVTDPGEILAGGDFYDYDHKYGPDAMESTATPDLPEEVVQSCKAAARTLYRMMDCSGWARLDFLLTDDGTLYFSEINPIPGCTPISLYPRLCAEQGISYTELLTRLIRLGRTRHAVV